MCNVYTDKLYSVSSLVCVLIMSVCLHVRSLSHSQPGASPLYVACQNGHEAVATLLLDRGAVVDLVRKVA